MLRKAILAGDKASIEQLRKNKEVSDSLLLHSICATRGNAKLLTWALDELRLPIDIPNKWSETPLFSALKEKERPDMEMVKVLVRHGTNLFHKNNQKMTPLQMYSSLNLENAC